MTGFGNSTFRPNIGAAGFCSWFGTLVLFVLLERHGVDVPDAAAGLTSKLSNHGHDFFVQPWQAMLFSGALFGSIPAFFVGVAALNRAIKDRRYAMLLAAAATTSLIWVVLIYAVFAARSLT